jgi:two-component system OmpR family sensor kinase
LNRLPIRLRLTFAFAIAMALVLAGMGFFVYLRVGDALLGTIDVTLRGQASEAVAHAQRGTDLGDRDVEGGATLAQLLAANGRVIRSDPAGLAPLLSAQEARAVSVGRTLVRSTTLQTPKGDWRVLATPTHDEDGRVVAVARSLEPREESLDHLFDELMVAAPLALLLASLAGYGLAAAALRPVEAMRRRAAAVSASSPGRLPVPPSRDEISRLATTLNEMLARIEDAFEHERRFVADASHELRTPLALLRAEIEVTLRRPRTADELEATLRSAAEETERLSRLAEDLLLIARADRGTVPIRRAHIAAEDVLTTAARRFSGGAAPIGRSIVVEDTDVLLDADPDRLAQAIGNLIDNALSHGAGSIVLFALEKDESVELHVADSGPGFPAAFLPRAFDRFSRADEARGRGGSGLGLSIVELIATAHGGRAGAANRPEGGADVWVSLPLAGRPASRRDEPVLT